VEVVEAAASSAAEVVEEVVVVAVVVVGAVAAGEAVSPVEVVAVAEFLASSPRTPRPRSLAARRAIPPEEQTP
jgi:hypothetical protein